MPIDHAKPTLTLKEINEVLDYNLNDVDVTYTFYLQSIEKIKLRKKLIKKYGLSCLNYNDGKIGEELLLSLYCKKTNNDYWETKQLRTFRFSIPLAECVPDNVYFTEPKFIELVNYFKGLDITETKGAFKKKIIYKGVNYTYGTGGIHGCTVPGVYKSDDEYIIKSCDVQSLYPNIALVYGFYMRHLGPEFLEVYKDEIVGVRLAEKAKPKEEQDAAVIDALKAAANIPYGKSNEQFSFLYDPMYTMKTTIGGQLVLTMLAEQLSKIPDSQILMINTDGLEIKIKRSDEALYDDICTKWQAHTNLILEFDDYKTIWIRDINTYGAVNFKGKIKNKGALEVDKKLGSEPAYHKDNSFRIVPLAVQEYFANNVPIEETITKHLQGAKYDNNDNYGIYDFCGRQKFTRESHGELVHLNGSKAVRTKTQKNVRYYISNKGFNFVKKYTKGSTEAINKGYLVTPFNKFEDYEYDINMKFYIKECNKIIDTIKPKQISLL